MKKKITSIMLISIACSFGIFSLLKLSANKQDLDNQVYRADSTKAVLITWEKARYKTVNSSFILSGSFEPNKEVQIFSERSGKVTNVGVELGDFIRKGKLIAHLDNEELSLNLENTQTLYEDAIRTYERNKVLASGGALTQNALEKSELSVKTFKNSIDVMRKQMTYLNIFAPMSGYITFKSFEIGSIVSPGIPIATITDIEFVKLNLMVPEYAITNIRKGSTIAVKCDAFPENTLPGYVDFVSVKSDDSKNFLVKIKVKNHVNNPIRAGMFGKAYFKNNTPAKLLMVSRSSIVGSTKAPQVYVVNNGKAVLRNILLGKIIDNNIEVIGGLAEGELVANSGLVNLTNGIKVSKALN